VKLSLPFLALFVFACGSEEFDVPKPFHGSLPDDPSTCGEVRASGSANEGQVIVDGKPATCVGEKVSCAVSDLPAFQGACLNGLANAVCITQTWGIRCDLDSGSATPVDGGDGG
jgi:hypothetical protein